jgi:transposase
MGEMMFHGGMKTLRVRDITPEERQVIENGLKSASAFTVRRCQILLMSADEDLKPREIGERLRCSDQCVRDALRAFERESTACLTTKSRARHTPQATFDVDGRQWLSEGIKQSPRTFGYETSIWTLKLLAHLAQRKGWSDHVVRPETVGRALREAGINWKRAKHRITSPDEHYAVKKSDAIG